jgi:hypothetical protein
MKKIESGEISVDDEVLIIITWLLFPIKLGALKKTGISKTVSKDVKESSGCCWVDNRSDYRS